MALLATAPRFAALASLVSFRLQPSELSYTLSSVYWLDKLVLSGETGQCDEV